MELVEYTKIHRKLIESYRLSEDQLRFTSQPLNCITLEDDLRSNILVLNENKLVTFFTLDRGDDAFKFSGNEQSILIRSFSTSFHHQGKGYAKKALQLLPTYLQVHFPNVNEIVLAVNVKNHAAQGLYTRCGFQDTAKRCQGARGPLIIMNKIIIPN